MAVFQYVQLSTVKPVQANFSTYTLGMSFLGRRHVPVVRMLGLHEIAPCSNPGLTSGQDLLPVVLDSTQSLFVNSQRVAFCQLGILIMFLLS